MIGEQQFLYLNNDSQEIAGTFAASFLAGTSDRKQRVKWLFNLRTSFPDFCRETTRKEYLNSHEHVRSARFVRPISPMSGGSARAIYLDYRQVVNTWLSDSLVRTDKHSRYRRDKSKIGRL